jgi:hypothetical protein
MAKAADHPVGSKPSTRELHEVVRDAAAVAAADDAPGPSQRVAPRSLASATASGLDCAAYVNDHMVWLTDRTVFHIAPVGAASVTIDRQNYEGRKVRLATALPGTRAEFADTRRAGIPTYSATFRFSDGTSRTCTSGNAAQSHVDLAVAGGNLELFATAPMQNASVLASRLTDYPAFSADGRWLGYSALSQDTGLSDLYLRRADGTGAGTPLPSTSGDDIALDFSFDGRYAVYTSFDATDTPHLQLIDLSTRTQRTIPDSTGLDGAVWVPDGRLLAADYASDAAPLVYVSPATGRTAETVPGSTYGYQPDVAADGTIVYVAYDEASGLEQLRAVRGGTTKVVETLPETKWLMAVRIDPEYTSTVLTTTATMVLDPATGEPVDVTTAMESYDIVSGTSPTSIAGSQPIDFPVSFAIREPRSIGTSDFTGDRRNDLLARDGSGVLWVYPSTSQPNTQVTLGARVRVGGGWNTMTMFAAAGDMNSDGRADVIARDTTGVLWVYPGTGGTSPVLGTRQRISGGWGPYAVVAGGDYNADLRADILARDGAGTLWLYPGTGTGGAGASAISARKPIGNGWNVMDAIVVVGDANYDGRPDVYARDRSTLYAYLYPGTGAGTFGARTSLGCCLPATAFAGIESHPDRDDFVSLAYRMPGDGALWVTRFWGDGALEGGHWRISTGWTPYTISG